MSYSEATQAAPAVLPDYEKDGTWAVYTTFRALLINLVPTAPNLQRTVTSSSGQSAGTTKAKQSAQTGHPFRNGTLTPHAVSSHTRAVQPLLAIKFFLTMIRFGELIGKKGEPICDYVNADRLMNRHGEICRDNFECLKQIGQIEDVTGVFAALQGQVAIIADQLPDRVDKVALLVNQLEFALILNCLEVVEQNTNLALSAAREALSEGNSDLDRQVGEILNTLGRILERRGRYDEAISTYTEAIKSVSDDSCIAGMSHLLIARCYLAQKLFDPAETELRRVIARHQVTAEMFSLIETLKSELANREQ
jgi:tetratricopeptide (TPR) repeat protein